MPVSEWAVLYDGKDVSYSRTLSGLSGVSHEGSQVEWAFGYCGVMDCSIVCLVINDYTGKGLCALCVDLYSPS